MHRLGIRVKKNERGVALLVVLTTIALLASVVADFQFNSRVDLQLAYNSRDALQAEQNALSALRVRALILRQSRKLQGALSGVFSSLGMDAGAAPGIGQILEMLPVDCGILSMLVKVGEDGDFDTSDEDDVEGTETQDFMVGECTAISESEHAKISINMLRNKLNKKDAILIFSVGGGSKKKNISTNLVKAIDFAKKKRSKDHLDCWKIRWLCGKKIRLLFCFT